MIDYEFFEVSRREQRCYRTDWDKPMRILRRLRELKAIEIVDDGEHELAVRGSHMMDPGCPVGLAQVNERLGITLPADIDLFYRRYDGGFLLFRELYRLTPASEIIELNLRLRAGPGERQDIPFGTGKGAWIRKARIWGVLTDETWNR